MHPSGFFFSSRAQCFLPAVASLVALLFASLGCADAFNPAAYNLNSRCSQRYGWVTHDLSGSCVGRKHYRRTSHVASSPRDREVERLQRENEELKKKLASSKGKSKEAGFNPLKALGEIHSC